MDFKLMHDFATPAAPATSHFALPRKMKPQKEFKLLNSINRKVRNKKKGK